MDLMFPGSSKVVILTVIGIHWPIFADSMNPTYDTHLGHQGWHAPGVATFRQPSPISFQLEQLLSKRIASNQHTSTRKWGGDWLFQDTPFDK